jgi:hypothetical protein
MGRHWVDIRLTTSQAQVGHRPFINLATSATTRRESAGTRYQSHPRCAARTKLGSALDTQIEKTLGSVSLIARIRLG